MRITPKRQFVLDISYAMTRFFPQLNFDSRLKRLGYSPPKDLVLCVDHIIDYGYPDFRLVTDPEWWIDILTRYPKYIQEVIVNVPGLTEGIVEFYDGELCMVKQ